MTEQQPGGIVGPIITHYTANNLNQYTGIGATSAPGYDANGNTTSLAGWSYSYDAQGRLIGGTSVEGGSFTFAYDPLGRCAARTINGTTTANLYSGWSLIEETTAAGSSCCQASARRLAG